jgi:hypothetical protein
MKEIYLLWTSFVECDCSNLKLLIVWLLDILLIVLILRCAMHVVVNARHHNTSSVTEMIHSLDWPRLQERRLKTRLHIFYKIINSKIAVPYDNIIWVPTEQQYSSLGRRRDWYALSFTDFELIWRLRLMKNNQQQDCSSIW